MDKQQKQIEEMVNDVRSYYHGSEYDELEDDISFSEHLVNLGWIKLDENAAVLTREEVKIYQKIYDFMKEKGIVSVEEMKTLISFALKSSMLKSHIVKETAEKIMNDISNDIIVVNTKEYGNIEVVPIERLQEILQTLGVNE